MNGPIKHFLEDFSLSLFYKILLQQAKDILSEEQTQDLTNLAPFIRQFQARFVNYYGLKKSPPFNQDYENRLEELYTDFADKLLKEGVSATIPWFVSQEGQKNKPLFPNKPVPSNYQDIMRSLSVLIDLVKCSTIGLETYQFLFDHAQKVLSPAIDSEYEEEAKELLRRLAEFDGRKDREDTAKLQQLEKAIKGINAKIQHKLMSNNSFVSIVQQISEINNALKSIRKSDFEQVLADPTDLLHFWNGLKELGYTGGDNYLQGSPQNLENDLTTWLSETFPQKAERLHQVILKTITTDQLPILEKENIPDAIHLYAINLIGALGLRTGEAIQLVLKYYSRFVEKTVREGALYVLKGNKESVQAYFLKSLGEAEDYDLQISIAEKHDSIYEQIAPEALTTCFGAQFEPILKELAKITAPDGILLSNFMRSAYLKLSDGVSKSEQQAQLLRHFEATNQKLTVFKTFVEARSPDGFIHLIRLWGLSYIVSWSLSDYEAEERLFSLIIKSAEDSPLSATTGIDRSIPLQNIITLLSAEPDAKVLIQKLMTFLLNSKISFDYRLFCSLFQVVAQRHQQLQNGIKIRDGFSEQRGYTLETVYKKSDEVGSQLQDPHIYHPIVIFLITVLNMKFINIPKDAFVETDISLYLNSLAENQKNPELGYQMHLAHQLISSIPYIKDFSSHHETIIRKTIADLDESYKRTNILIHYLRIKIHRAPSKLDLDFCLEILEGISSRELPVVLKNLTRLMKGIGDEAVPDLEAYFEHYQEKLTKLGRHLTAFKAFYPALRWQEIAEDVDFTRIVRDLPDIDADSSKDIIALIKLANALSNYWTQRVNDHFLGSLLTEADKTKFKNASLNEKLRLIRDRRQELKKAISCFDPYLEPYQHIFLKRHVIQGDWNFDFFGFWPYYKESKFEAYNSDRKLAALESDLLEKLIESVNFNDSNVTTIKEETLHLLRENIHTLKLLMLHLVGEGLTPSKFFLDTIEIFRHDQLTISQLHDILGILNHRELSHIDSFIANTYGHFPARITKALGRENLDFGLDKLSITDEELLYPLVQETVLGNIMASARPIHLLERHLNQMLSATAALKKKNPSQEIFPEHQRTASRLSPVTYGYKSYALQTLKRDGFNVPALETLPVDYFAKEFEGGQPKDRYSLRRALIVKILQLESQTGKYFNFSEENLTPQEQALISEKRSANNPSDMTGEPLLVSARSGSYRSMPGILGTVLNIGYRDVTAENYQSTNLRFELDTYRMFLSTFGNVVFGINEKHFSKIVEQAKHEVTDIHHRKIKWEDLDQHHIINISNQFKTLIEEHQNSKDPQNRIKLDWDDPLELLVDSVIGVWNSWESPAAQKLRKFLDISEDWKTPVTIMEMKQADKNPQSFSAILFSGDPQGKVNKPHGDLLFGRPGEDIASGLASEGVPLESIASKDPALYDQIADLLEQVKINKGYVNVDVEMVGEYDPDEKKMELFVVQERQMPLGTRGESEDFKLTPTDIPPIATGKGVNGGVQYGVFLDGIQQDYYELKRTVAAVRKKLGKKDRFHGPGIFLLMKYVTPEEALKMNIEGVDGVITTKIGKSSHASISAKRDGKLFICESTITETPDGWFIGDQPVQSGTSESPDVFTVVGHPKSVSPYSGNIYKGRMELTNVKRHQ